MTNDINISVRSDINESLPRLRKSTSRFDWWYMFVMVIYMGMATSATKRMVNTLSGNPVPLLLPMILTFILYARNRISFKSRGLLVVTSIYLIWSILSIVKWKEYTITEFSYYFFPLYNIIVAYIQVKVFGKRLITLYENVIVVFAKISLVFWIIYLLHIPFFDEMAKEFPETGFGNSIFYIYSWSDLSKLSTGVFTSNEIRNSGCAWEAGRFSVMIVLGIYCNICRNGFKVNGNKNLIWLMAALVSTFSTTGIVTTACLYFITLFRKINIKTILTAVALLPVFYGIYSLDFVGKKITTKLEESQDVSRLMGRFASHNITDQEDEYLGSIDRLDAAVLETVNLYNDPLLGYSNNFKHSFFYQEITTNYRLANGLVNVLSTYGILFGCVIFYWLFKSSRKIAEIFPNAQRYALIVVFALSAISYRIYSIPVFTSFWLFGIFYNQPDKKML